MDIIEVHNEWFDTTIDDAFSYRSRKLLEKIKKIEKDRDAREAA